MFEKSRVTFFAFLILLSTSPASDVLAKSRRLWPAVTTRIILNWENRGIDVCFAHNASGTPVTAYFDIFPFGSGAKSGYGALVGPVSMKAIDDQMIWNWQFVDWKTEKCTVRSVRYK
jgi:hypothetical protein